MFRIKFCLAAMLLLCLTAALAESPSLIPADRIVDERTHYNTIPVELGTYEHSVAGNGTKYYPATRVLRCQQPNARFLEYRAERGDSVKKGDILAVFTLEFDEAAYAEKELALARAREALRSGEESARQELEILEQSLLKAASSQDQALIKLKIQRAELAQEQQLQLKKREIADLEEALAEMDADRKDNALIAPVDGVIETMEYKREGDRVYEGEALITIQREDILMLAVDNAEGKFRYGMQVSFELGKGKDKRQAAGRIVCADTLMPAAERVGYALIEVELPEGEVLNRATVTAAKVSVNNVMLLPRRAVKLEGGRNYVMQLIDGVAQKRFINCVMESGAKTVWVLQGLAPGDQIIMD